MTKVRAGTAYGCAFVNSGCNWPEGDCAGNCLIQTRRVEPQVKPVDELPVQMHDDEQSSMRGLAVALLLTFFMIVIGSFLVVVMV